MQKTRDLSTLLHEIFSTDKFREFRDTKKNREIKVTRTISVTKITARKLSDSHGCCQFTQEQQFMCKHELLVNFVDKVVLFNSRRC